MQICIYLYYIGQIAQDIAGLESNISEDSRSIKQITSSLADHSTERHQISKFSFFREKWLRWIDGKTEEQVCLDLYWIPKSVWFSVNNYVINDDPDISGFSEITNSSTLILCVCVWGIWASPMMTQPPDTFETFTYDHSGRYSRAIAWFDARHENNRLMSLDPSQSFISATAVTCSLAAFVSRQFKAHSLT